MTIFDRYVIGLFLKILAVCFCSLAGLYLIIDIFGNIDEFVALGKRDGGLLTVLANYYGPRLIGLFCEVAGLLYLLAAICTMTRLQNTSELAAVQSAGVSVRRIAMPLVVVSAILCFGTLAAREIALPYFNDTLVQNAQDLLKNKGKNAKSQIDYKSLVTISGQSVDFQKQEITKLKLVLPHDWPGSESTIEAEYAYWKPANGLHSAGLVLRNPKSQKEVTAATVRSGDQVLLYSGKETQWLENKEAFLPTGIPFSQICFGPAWIHNASMKQVSLASRSGSIRLPASHLVTVHWRMVRPLMDFCLLLIGLPLVLRGTEMRLVTAAVTCIGIVGLIQLVAGVFQFLGGSKSCNHRPSPPGLPHYSSTQLGFGCFPNSIVDRYSYRLLY